MIWYSRMEIYTHNNCNTPGAIILGVLYLLEHPKPNSRLLKSLFCLKHYTCVLLEIRSPCSQFYNGNSIRKILSVHAWASENVRQINRYKMSRIGHYLQIRLWPSEKPIYIQLDSLFHPDSQRIVKMLLNECAPWLFANSSRSKGAKNSGMFTAIVNLLAKSTRYIAKPTGSERLLSTSM